MEKPSVSIQPDLQHYRLIVQFRYCRVGTSSGVGEGGSNGRVGETDRGRGRKGEREGERQLEGGGGSYGTGREGGETDRGGERVGEGFRDR